MTETTGERKGGRQEAPAHSSLPPDPRLGPLLRQRGGRMEQQLKLEKGCTVTCPQTSSSFLNPSHPKSSTATLMPLPPAPALILLSTAAVPDAHPAVLLDAIPLCTSHWEALDKLHFSTLQKCKMLQLSQVKCVFSRSTQRSQQEAGSCTCYLCGGTDCKTWGSLRHCIKQHN